MEKVNIIFLAIFVIVITALSMLFFQPRFLLDILAFKYPGAIYYVDTDQKAIALTIDDSPDPTSTAEILDILSDYDVKATFFVICGNVNGNEGIINRMVNEGHELGNHNMKETPSIKLSPQEFESQLLECDSILSNYHHSKWYRPGSGWYNSRLVKQVENLGYRIALASLHPFDPQLPSSRYGIFQILTSASPGSIILLHDGRERGPRTAKILRAIIPLLLKRGYKIVTLTELTKLASINPRGN